MKLWKQSFLYEPDGRNWQYNLLEIALQLWKMPLGVEIVFDVALGIMDPTLQ